MQHKQKLIIDTITNFRNILIMFHIRTELILKNSPAPQIISKLFSIIHLYDRVVDQFVTGVGRAARSPCEKSEQTIRSTTSLR